jgi:tetratricopeptide (TPR) repeat protein
MSAMGFWSKLFGKKEEAPLDLDAFQQEHWQLDTKSQEGLRFPLVAPSVTSPLEQPAKETLESKGFSLSVQGKALQGRQNRGNNFSWTINPFFQYRDFALSFQGQWVETQGYGALVLIFRYVNDENFYYLSLSTKGMIRVDALFNAKPYTVLPWTEAFEAGAGFDLDLICRGRVFHLYQNGQWLAEMVDDYFSSGRFGLGGQLFEPQGDLKFAINRWELESRPSQIVETMDRLEEMGPSTPAQRFSLAQGFFSVGKYEEAVHQLLAMPISSAEKPEEGLLFVESLRRSGDTRKALQELENLLLRFPDWQEGRREKAQLLYVTNAFLDLKVFLLENFSDDLSGTLAGLLGHAYFNLGNWQEAAKYYQRASEGEGTDPLWSLNAARAFTKAGDREKAKEAFIKAGKAFLDSDDLLYWPEIFQALSPYNNDPEVLSLTGKAAYLQGDHQGALRIFTNLEKAGRSDASTLYLMGLLHRQTSEALALEFFQRASESEDYYLFHLRLAEAQRAAGEDYQDALQRALAGGEEDPWLQNFLGIIAQEPLERLEHFRRAYERAPREIALRINYADALWKNDQKQKAWEIMESSPEDPAVANQIGLFYLWSDEPQKAMRFFRQAIAQEPEYRDYIENALDAAEALESFSEAESLIIRLLDQGNRPEDYVRLGALLIRYGDVTRGEVALRTALEISPGHLGALKELGWHYARRSRLERVEDVLAHWPVDDQGEPEETEEYHRLWEYFLKSTHELLHCASCDQQWWVPLHLESQPPIRLKGEPPGNAPAGASKQTGKIYCINCAQNHMKGPRFVCPETGDYLSLEDDRLKYLLHKIVEASSES